MTRRAIVARFIGEEKIFCCGVVSDDVTHTAELYYGEYKIGLSDKELAEKVNSSMEADDIFVADLVTMFKEYVAKRNQERIEAGGEKDGATPG